MKKTFRFLSIALLACCMTLVGCNPTPEDENDDTNNNQNPSVSYSFDGVADWPITSSYVGYEYAEGDTLIYVLGSKDAKELNELINVMDGEEYPSNVFLASFLGKPGVQTGVGNILSEETAINAIFITGSTVLYDMTIPTGWVSTEMTVNVSAIDLTGMKVSATASANMKDIIKIFAEAFGLTGIGSDQERVFTLTVNNMTMTDWWAEK